MVFRDRRDAGRRLGEWLARLRRYSGDRDAVVLALPRGGVPVGYEVASALGAPLDVFIVRKLGVPGHEEVAMGAIASGGVQVLDERVTSRIGISARAIERVAEKERRELERRERAYLKRRPRLELVGKTVILVDDGLATGSTMRAAVAAVRKLGPKRLVVAVPVAAADTCHALAAEADDVVCVQTPEPFHAVGAWYDDFAQTDDDEVRELLAAATDEGSSGLAHAAAGRGADAR